MDAIPRKLPREELEVRAFKAQEITGKLSDLARTDGWKTLVEIFEAAEKLYYTTLTRQLMQGREINQRKLDHNRGIFDGVRNLLEQPAKAEESLRKLGEALKEIDDKE